MGNTYYLDCNAVVTVKVEAEGPREAGTLVRELVDYFDDKFVPPPVFRALRAEAHVTVEPVPVFGYATAPDGTTLSDDGLPAEGAIWTALMHSLGQAMYTASLAVSHWHDNSDADRANTIDAIKHILDTAVAPRLSELSADG